jgi:peptidyl-prolyl cis-trans isomerase A (cyclophilin A)
VATGVVGASGFAGCTSSGDNGTGDENTDDGDPSDNGGTDGGESSDSGNNGDSNGGEAPDDSDDSGTQNGGTRTATLETNFGDIEIELYGMRAPRTVENFVGLATGEKAWRDPETGEEVDGEPLYEDVIFHRIIEGFVIQGGDPTGTGRGGPGYQFDDEFHPELRHDEAGVLSMANSGPDTNGSQFFITLSPQPQLDDRHSVFGAVVDGMDVVREIGGVETNERDRPVDPVILESVTVHDG